MRSISERTVILHDALVSLAISVVMFPGNELPGGTEPRSSVAVEPAQNKEYWSLIILCK